MATTSALPPGVAVTPQAPNDDTSRPGRPKPPKQTLCPNAKLRIHLEDLSDPTTTAVLKQVDLGSLLQTAILDVQEHLFTLPSQSAAATPPPTTLITSPLATPTPTTTPALPTPAPVPTILSPQEVRSITLVLEAMDGVAYTTGTSLDEAHKEIHLSLSYCHSILRNNPNNPTALAHELLGVTTHESVHCFQHTCHDTAPAGLIEGIADYVRLKAGRAPAHWKRFPADRERRGEKWDEGYQKTAWFLEWCERETGLVGRGVCLLNKAMREGKWREGECWRKCFGEGVETMWERYCEGWEEENRKHGY